MFSVAAAATERGKAAWPKAVRVRYNPLQKNNFSSLCRRSIRGLSVWSHPEGNGAKWQEDEGVGRIVVKSGG
jgi:hypothetical protein